MEEVQSRREALPEVEPLGSEKKQRPLTAWEKAEKARLEQEQARAERAAKLRQESMLRDKIMLLKQAALDQYPTIADALCQVRDFCWGAPTAQVTLEVARHVNSVKALLESVATEAACHQKETFKPYPVTVGGGNLNAEEKLMLIKQTIDVTLDNVGVAVRALMAGIRTEADPQKIVSLAKHMRSFHDLLLLQPYACHSDQEGKLQEAEVQHLEQQNYQEQNQLYQQGQEYSTTPYEEIHSQQQQQQYQEEEAFYQSFNEQQPEEVMQQQDDYMGLLATDPNDADYNHLLCYNNNYYSEEQFSNSPYDYSQQQPIDSQLSGDQDFVTDLTFQNYDNLTSNDSNDYQQVYNYSSQQMYY